MRTTFEATFTRSAWFIRLGRLEMHLEFNHCAAPEGWLSVTPSMTSGVVMINLGQLTAHVENTTQSAKHFAAMRSNAATVW
jgi:hypothetical protein